MQHRRRIALVSTWFSLGMRKLRSQDAELIILAPEGTAIHCWVYMPNHENSFDKVEGRGIRSAKIAKGGSWVVNREKLTRRFTRSATTRWRKSWSSLCKIECELPVAFCSVHYHHRRQLLRCFARLRDQCEPIRPSRNVMQRRISEPRVWRDFAATALGFTNVAPVVHVLVLVQCIHTCTSVHHMYRTW